MRCYVCMYYSPVMQRMCHEMAQQYNTSSTSQKALTAHSVLACRFRTYGEALCAAGCCNLPRRVSSNTQSLQSIAVFHTCENSKVPSTFARVMLQRICILVKVLGIDSSEGDLLLAFEAFIGTSCPSK